MARFIVKRAPHSELTPTGLRQTLVGCEFRTATPEELTRTPANIPIGFCEKHDHIVPRFVVIAELTRQGKSAVSYWRSLTGTPYLFLKEEDCQILEDD